ncbi:MAG: hypothetical protein JO336_09440 [Acidobacteriia bacterium]|nr:hypothetical protein [Terriglobia bacterium]MBV8906427.1 hypothetical protein [Terriglobia bacterium]MBV9743176.1 hypothetical protein [Terriglobia bacterium]
MGIEANRTPGAETVNPADILPVRDFSPHTLTAIIAHLEASTTFDHLVYREAELDAIWSITGFALGQQPKPEHQDAVRRLHEHARMAHDLVGEAQPLEAADLLRVFCK